MQGTEKISRMYAQSLVMVFDECIIANLTADHYVNCQKDAMWSDIPEQGNFGAENRKYAKLVMHPEDLEEFDSLFSRDAMLRLFLEGKKKISKRLRRMTKDVGYHMAEFTAVRICEAEEDDCWCALVFRDVQEEYLAEQQKNLEIDRLREEAFEKERRSKQLLEDALQKAEDANRAKGEFLSRMSHDIRTPMNAILGMAELAQLNLGDEEKTRDYLSKIKSSGAHLLGLINEVLDVSKIESGKLQMEEIRFDLRAAVRDTAELIRLSVDKRSQTLLVELDDRLYPQVIGDEQRLKQVLVNILDNASKYTPDGGTISLRLDELDKGEFRTGTYRFVIEDNGIGMKPEFLEHIFDPFSRAGDSRTNKVSGTGLGMTIVKNLVSVMGGDIRVESEYGKGTRFEITLCLGKTDRKPEEDLHKEEKQDLDFGELRVLLVEDNELNRQIATEMMELLGAQTEIAEDGQQAVDAVCSNPPFYYDLVFMDVQMPNMNGYDATRAIRSSGMEKIDDLPIIAMTADAFAEDARQARMAGMNGHLAKPISMEQLRHTLAECLAWKQKNRGRCGKPLMPPYPES